ncbi:MAG: hypothetical protein Fur0037_25780 [Planctomycetota bacterium]
MRRIATALPGLVVGSCLLFALLYVLGAGRTAGDGPWEPLWNKTTCAYCSMHVGEPAYAAELLTRSGEALLFDDPGCLFAYLESREEPAGMWFHALQGEGWIAADRVAFVRVPVSPMGFGLGAVARGYPDSLGLDEAREICRESHGRGDDR